MDKRAPGKPTPWRWDRFSVSTWLDLCLSSGIIVVCVCVCVCVCVFQGAVNDPGINQRALRLLFSEVMDKAPDWDYKITVSMVEIYNETLR